MGLGCFWPVLGLLMGLQLQALSLALDHAGPKYAEMLGLARCLAWLLQFAACCSHTYVLVQCRHRRKEAGEWSCCKRLTFPTGRGSLVVPPFG